MGGLVREKRFFRWVNVTHSRGSLYSPHGVILNLNAERRILEAELLRWLKSPLAGVPNRKWATVPGIVNPFEEVTDKESIAIRDFVSQGERWEDWSLWQRWFSVLSKIQDPKMALGFSSSLFRELIDKKIDPRTTAVKLPPLPMPPLQIALPEIRSKFHLTMPILKDRKSKEKHREVVAFSTKVIPEAPIFQLCGQHILIAIGGESGAGKSTMAASLLVAMRNVIKMYQSRDDTWAKLDLGVEMVSLDEATPVADSILRSSAQNRGRLKAIKRDWTLELAESVVQNCKNKLESANIVLADMPGKITDITELISAQISFGGIITRDWTGEGRKWRNHFEAINAPLVFQVKSGRQQSLVTTYDYGEQLLGRIFLPNRTVRAWDPFTVALAQLLLIDILPAKIAKPQNQLINRCRREDKCITVRLQP